MGGYVVLFQPRIRRRGGCLTKRQLLSLGCLLGSLVLGAAGTAAATGEPRWAETGTAHTDTLGGGQGLASRADGTLLYRGLASVPLELRLKGWNHVGDPSTGSTRARSSTTPSRPARRTGSGWCRASGATRTDSGLPIRFLNALTPHTNSVRGETSRPCSTPDGLEPARIPPKREVVVLAWLSLSTACIYHIQRSYRYRRRSPRLGHSTEPLRGDNSRYPYRQVTG